jgi:hypothetical protein
MDIGLQQADTAAAWRSKEKSQMIRRFVCNRACRRCTQNGAELILTTLGWQTSRKRDGVRDYHPPRPWRSKAESAMIERFVALWFTCRDPNRPSQREWARQLGRAFLVDENLSQFSGWLE